MTEQLIKITKIGNAPKSESGTINNNVPIGTVHKGIIVYQPEIGKRFIIRLQNNSILNLAPVIMVEYDNKKFANRNSTYQWEIISE